MIHSIQALANYGQQNHFNNFRNTSTSPVDHARRINPTDVISLSNEAANILANGNSMHLDLSRALADIRLSGGYGIELLSTFDNRIKSDQYVALTKVSDHQITINIGDDSNGSSKSTTFDVYLNINGTIRGFDTDGSGSINTIQAPTLNLTNSDGTETTVELTFAGITGATALGLVASQESLSLLLDREHIDSSTTRAILAYAKANIANTETTRDSYADTGGTTPTNTGGTTDTGGATESGGTDSGSESSVPGKSGESNGKAHGKNK